MPNINLAPTNWQTEQEEIARRRKMAEMLQQQSYAPVERFSTNGIEAPISWTQGLAKMLQAYQGGKGQREATETEKALGERYQSEGQGALARGLRSLQGQTIQPDPQEAQQSADFGTPEVGPVNVPPDRTAAMQAFGSHPETKGYANAIMAQILKGEETKAYKPGDVLYRGNKQVGAIPNTPKEHVIGGNIYQSAPEGVKNLGGPGIAADPNKPFKPDGTPNTGFQTYSKELKVLGAPKTTVSVDNRALGKYADVVGGKSGEDDIAQLSTAQVAVENAEKLDKTLSLLKNSNAITGMGADILKNVERVKVLIANDKKAGKKVSDTEYLNALLGSDVFPMIKELGIGARGLDTPAEREFLREVMSGTINMNKDTLIRLTQVRRDIAQRAMDRWNKRVKSGELDEFFKFANRPKSTIDYQPSGDTAVSGEWNPAKESRYQELLRKRNAK